MEWLSKALSLDFIIKGRQRGAHVDPPGESKDLKLSLPLALTRSYFSEASSKFEEESRKYYSG
jgi:hypothetical protein